MSNPSTTPLLPRYTPLNEKHAPTVQPRRKTNYKLVAVLAAVILASIWGYSSLGFAREDLAIAAEDAPPAGVAANTDMPVGGGSLGVVEMPEEQQGGNVSVVEDPTSEEPASNEEEEEEEEEDKPQDPEEEEVEEPEQQQDPIPTDSHSHPKPDDTSEYPWLDLKANPPSWTPILPPASNSSYPLSAKVYGELCTIIHAAPERLAHLENPHGEEEDHVEGGHSGHFSYYHEDPTFIPPPSSGQKGICEKSLTLLLRPHLSMGESVMLVSLASGLAKKEGRTFFLDDTDWAWSNWTDFFTPPPSDCKPPTWEERLPCLPTAPHRLLDTASTLSSDLGHGFDEEFQDPYKAGTARQEKIFSLLVDGLGDTWNLSEHLQQQVDDAVSKLTENETFVHVRHGDGRPREYWWHKGYLPLERYLAVAQSLSSDESGSIRVLTDDWELQAALAEGGGDGVGLLPLRHQPLLPVSANVEGAEPEIPSRPWELPEQPKRVEKVMLPGYTRDSLTTMEEEQKRMIAEGWIIDLGVVFEALDKSDGKGRVVCGGASATCRLLAAGVGWEGVVGTGEGGRGWVDVDGYIPSPSGTLGEGGEWRGWIW